MVRIQVSGVRFQVSGVRFQVAGIARRGRDTEMRDHKNANIYCLLATEN